MITWHEELPFNFSDPITEELFTEQAVFFDIETTGFSAARTSLYLIGCATRHGTRLFLDQFFSEGSTDEAELLLAFSSLLSQHDTILSFNGAGFDIPYLRAKYISHGIPDPFDSCGCIDLYRKLVGLKTLLALPDLKQKSIEAFLGLTREDTCSGGELIEVYHAYLRHPSGDLLAMLRLHNYEDVLSMPKLLPILSYRHIFDGKVSLCSVEADETVTPDGTPRRALLFTLRLAYPVPNPVSLRHDDCYLTARSDTLRLYVRLLDDELAFYFDDPKEYYYLPDEDRAVHKSLSIYVDPTHRRQATAATCYTKKHALFLPQYGELITPAFYRKRPRTAKERPCYFELTEDFLTSDKQQTRYVRHLLSHMVPSRTAHPS